MTPKDLKTATAVCLLVSNEVLQFQSQKVVIVPIYHARTYVCDVYGGVTCFNCICNGKD